MTWMTDLQAGTSAPVTTARLETPMTRTVLPSSRMVTLLPCSVVSRWSFFSCAAFSAEPGTTWYFRTVCSRSCER